MRKLSMIMLGSLAMHTGFADESCNLDESFILDENDITKHHDNRYEVMEKIYEEISLDEVKNDLIYILTGHVSLKYIIGFAEVNCLKEDEADKIVHISDLDDYGRSSLGFAGCIHMMSMAHDIASEKGYRFVDDAKKVFEDHSESFDYQENIQINADQVTVSQVSSIIERCAYSLVVNYCHLLENF